MEALDASITSRQVLCSDLSVHILECGDPKDEMILLLHGFPELAYSWRQILPLLARNNYYVVAPDMRGYGRTISKDADPSAKSTLTYDAGTEGWGMVDTLSDLISLIYKLHSDRHRDPSDGAPVVRSVVGHDMGSSVAANLALLRPDIFRSLVMMSAPFTGPPPAHTPSHSTTMTTNTTSSNPSLSEMSLDAKTSTLRALDSLNPPLKHYQLYFAGASANDDLMRAPQGLQEFFRGYYYFKSALWHENNPHPLGTGWTVEGITQMPEYYVMQKDYGMADTVRRHVPLGDEEGAEGVRRKMAPWMSEAELAFYVGEFQRTGFQGGLNHYRTRTGGQDSRQLRVLTGRRLCVPTTFISGERDWGNYQDPGAIERMASEQVVERADLFKGCTFVPNAGHWVQQEQPKGTVGAILSFLQHTATTGPAHG